ncbi:hypothetical protein EDB86DRAFT_2810520, partial [Lactarius hatsudake]
MDFGTIFGAALEAHKKQTKKDVTFHPLATQLQSCDTPSAILAILRAQVQAFDQSQSADEKLTKWLDPTVNVLYAFSATLGEGVGLAFPPAKTIFTGIGVLLQAVKDVRASQNALVDLFGRMEYFFKRLEKYIDVRPTAAMTDIIVKIMVELISILGMVTKEIRQGRTMRYLKKLIGRQDVEDALQRLDQLTQEEARMAAVEALTITRGIDERVRSVENKVGSVTKALRLCVTSRPEFDIRTVLEPLATQQVSLHDESGQTRDIKNYVTDRRQMACKGILQRSQSSHGLMVSHRFRWVYCQLEVLRYCFPVNVRRALEEIPKSLDETYERILKEINNTNREHSYRLLQCLTVASRPLRVEELVELLAIDIDAGGIPKLNVDLRWDDQEEAVLSACSSLVTVIIDKGSRIVQFSHFSVKEFLTSNRLAGCTEEVSQFHIPIEPSHMILAQACLGALLSLDDHAEDEDSVKKFPLVRYAAEYWVGY